MIEEHGPHLPVGSDTLGVTYEATRVSHRVSRALPDWKVVMMPPINYGQGGANEIGGILVHSGTYAIRQSTLRSTVADIGGQVAQNGFKWLFVLNGHGGPPHNIAINEACDFVSETFKVTMLHVTALFRADPAIQSKGKKINEKYYSPAELASFGMDVHAGSGRHRPFWQFVPISWLRVTKRFPAWWGTTWANCFKSHPNRGCRVTYRRPPRRKLHTVKRSKPGGWKAFQILSCAPYAERTCSSIRVFRQRISPTRPSVRF